MTSTPGVPTGTRICDCCLEGGGVGIGLHHHDHDLAARIAETGDVIFLAVDDPFVAIELGGGRHILGVGGGDVRLGHHIGRADFAVQQRLQPLFLLLLGAAALQHFHIAGVGRRAVHALRAQRILAEFGGDEGIVEVAEAFAGLGVRQEEVPQALGLGLVLGLLQAIELARREAPAVGLALAERVILDLHRRNRLLQELAHMVVERLGLVRHAEVVEFVGRIEAEARGFHTHLVHGFSSRILWCALASARDLSENRPTRL